MSALLNSFRIGSPQSPPSMFSRVELEKIDDNLFRAPKDDLWKPLGARGIYGGQVIGQSLQAASSTVPKDYNLHSMHSYFLRAGEDSDSIIYYVRILRDGRSFSTRLVTARQRGRDIFILKASFHKKEQSNLQFQCVMPNVPLPKNIITAEERYNRLAKDPRCPKLMKKYLLSRAEMWNPLDMRMVQGYDMFSELGERPKDVKKHAHPIISQSPKQIFWMKSKSKLPDDPAVHRSIIAYASDSGLISTALNGTAPWDVRMIASLDHSMWFYSPFRADEWLLYEIESPRANDSRGLCYGKIFTMDGKLAAVIMQEGLIRVQNNSSKINKLKQQQQQNNGTAGKSKL